jgi:hypothetical protein
MTSRSRQAKPSRTGLTARNTAPHDAGGAKVELGHVVSPMRSRIGSDRNLIVPMARIRSSIYLFPGTIQPLDRSINPPSLNNFLIFSWFIPRRMDIFPMRIAFFRPYTA